ncbi:phage tail protein [Terriglobus tenax]|uniref:phage tail protein n=1 Tax=Terriglobus tenax TaxID=1111115 RepID=UPI0021DF94B9|nr:tail fiber protein [Terriglobus tenax]
MSDQYLGEIRIFGGNFAPSGWALCNGQLISISQNSALFAILGTTYGGDGVQTFALPNLQGRLPLHWGTSTTGSNYVLGEVSGSEKVTLLANNLPMHTHAISIPVNSGPADLSDPTGAIESTPNDPASGNPISSYTKNAATGAALPFQSGIAGSSIPISVMQPFLCVTFIIALVGIFPSRG